MDMDFFKLNLKDLIICDKSHANTQRKLQFELDVRMS